VIGLLEVIYLLAYSGVFLKEFYTNIKDFELNNTCQINESNMDGYVVIKNETWTEILENLTHYEEVVQGGAQMLGVEVDDAENNAEDSVRDNADEDNDEDRYFYSMLAEETVDELDSMDLINEEDEDLLYEDGSEQVAGDSDIRDAVEPQHTSTHHADKLLEEPSSKRKPRLLVSVDLDTIETLYDYASNIVSNTSLPIDFSKEYFVIRKDIMYFILATACSHILFLLTVFIS
jgi:hypothetical protein